MIDFKKQLKDIGLGLGIILILWGGFAYFKPPVYIIWAVLVALSASFLLWKKSFKWKILFKNSLYIAFVLVIFYFLKGFGFWGYVAGIAFICFLILFRRRKKFVETMEIIESRIWGKPLTEFKKEGEKIPKLKFKLK